MQGLLLLWLLACGWVGDVAADFRKDQLERLCRIATDVDRRGPPGGRHLVEIGERLARQVPELEQAWRAIEKAPPRMRKKLYDEMLAEAGLADFDCPPLERALTR